MNAKHLHHFLINYSCFIYKAGRKRFQHFHPTSKNSMLDEMLDSFERFQNLENLEKEGKKGKNHVGWKFVLKQIFIQHLFVPRDVGFVWDKFPSNIEYFSLINAISSARIWLWLLCSTDLRNYNWKQLFTRDSMSKDLVLRSLMITFHSKFLHFQKFSYSCVTTCVFYYFSSCKTN